MTLTRGDMLVVRCILVVAVVVVFEPSARGRSVKVDAAILGLNWLFKGSRQDNIGGCECEIIKF